MSSDRRAPTSRDVQLRCPSPTCSSEWASIAIYTASVVTFRCADCRFMWSADPLTLSEAVRGLLNSWAAPPLRKLG
jgi:transposase-like protein